MKSERKIAFVIDALPSLGGSEKVLFTALDVFPDADIFTLVYNRHVFINTPIANRMIRTSLIDHIPFAHKQHRLFLPLMPFAVERFNLCEYETIVSFHYAVAHGAQHPKDARHVSYTFTPMRYAWMDLNINGAHGRRNRLLAKYMQAFREWDRKAASRIHQFAAISHAVSARIMNAYQRDPCIVYPPVEVERFAPASEREKFFITVTRLVPHKRIDLLVKAFSELNLRLVVIGDGPESPRLMKMAGPTIQFLGYQSDEKVAELLGKARGFVCATEEDFGIAMVEAQAAGCPVIGYGRGGALETVINGTTGIFFSEQSVESLIDALQRFERIHSNFQSSQMVENAKRFDKECFKVKFREFVQPAKTN